jgi:cytochrome c oxidase subunit 2
MAKTLYRKQDLESVVLYLAALPPVKPPAALAGGDPAAGEARYALCATCHGPRGAGMPEMQAPRIAGQADWYLYRQLQKFKSGMRGAHPQDAMGAQMAAMAQTLEDTTAMKDVIAYVRTLAP